MRRQSRFQPNQQIQQQQLEDQQLLKDVQSVINNNVNFTNKSRFVQQPIDSQQQIQSRLMIESQKQNIIVQNQSRVRIESQKSNYIFIENNNSFIEQNESNKNIFPNDQQIEGEKDFVVPDEEYGSEEPRLSNAMNKMSMNSNKSEQLFKKQREVIKQSQKIIVQQRQPNGKIKLIPIQPGLYVPIASKNKELVNPVFLRYEQYEQGRYFYRSSFYLQDEQVSQFLISLYDITTQGINYGVRVDATVEGLNEYQKIAKPSLQIRNAQMNKDFELNQKQKIDTFAGFSLPPFLIREIWGYDQAISLMIEGNDPQQQRQVQEYIFNRLLGRFTESMDMVKFIQDRWNDLDAQYQQMVVENDELTQKLFDFVVGNVDSRVDEIVLEYKKLQKQSEHQLLRDNDFSRLINKYCVFCNLGVDDGKSGVDLDGFQKVIDVVNTNIVELEEIFKNLQNQYTIDLNLLQLKQFFDDLDSVTQGMKDLSARFSNFLRQTNLKVGRVIDQFLGLVNLFELDCQSFERIVGFTGRCELVGIQLQQCLGFMVGVKLPMSIEGHMQFNEMLLQNAQGSLNQAREDLQKYIDHVTGLFSESMKSELYTDIRRRYLITDIRSEMMSMQFSDAVNKYPMLILKKISVFGNCLSIQQVYEDDIKLINIYLDYYNQIQSIEKGITDINKRSSEIKSQFLKVQAHDIVQYQYKELQQLLYSLQQYQTQLSIVDWSRFGLMQAKILNSNQGIGTMPVQIMHLQQWLALEINGLQILIDNIESIQYDEQSAIQYQLDTVKQDRLYTRVQEIVQTEVSVRDIINNNDPNSEYRSILNLILQTAIQNAPNSDKTSIKFIDELQISLDTTFQKSKSPTLPHNQQQDYSIHYARLSKLYNEYTVWYNMQLTRCLMDGEVFGQIIMGTLILDASDIIKEARKDFPCEFSQTLLGAVKLLRCLRRGFKLNIKFNESCVFIIKLIEQGIQCLELIDGHQQKLLKHVNDQYNIKRSLNLDDINGQTLQKIKQLVESSDSRLSIIRDQIYGALEFYFAKNSYVFSTKGCTFQWDKKLIDTKQMLDEVVVVLEDAYYYLQIIQESQLLLHYKDKKINARINFEPEEFYMSSPQLLKLHQKKIIINRVYIEIESLLNNQIDQEQYRVDFSYFINIMDEILFWIKAIERASNTLFMLMGQIKDALFFEQLGEDFIIKQTKFYDDIEKNTKLIAQIQNQSPFSTNQPKQPIKPQPHFQIIIKISSKIDNLILLLHMISKIALQAISILQENANNLIIIQQFLKDLNNPIKINQQFFDTLNRIFIFFYGEYKTIEVNKATDYSKPIFDKSKGDEIFKTLTTQIPKYCPFPILKLTQSLKLYEPLYKKIMQLLDKNTINLLNQQIQQYLSSHNNPILSIENFVEDQQQILATITQQSVKSKMALIKYEQFCQANFDMIADYKNLIAFILDTLKKNTIYESNKNIVYEEDLLKQFITSEHSHWHEYIKTSSIQIQLYLLNVKQKQMDELISYTQPIIEIQIKIQEISKKLGQPKNRYINMLLQLILQLIQLINHDYELHQKK